jgi:hypothetical protein
MEKFTVELTTRQEVSVDHLERTFYRVYDELDHCNDPSRILHEEGFDSYQQLCLLLATAWAKKFGGSATTRIVE